jgi:integrase
MVFKRTGRPSLYFQAKTETGYKQLACHTASRPLAVRIEAMWGTLADDHRAWDVLNAVLAGRLAIGRLYDLWIETKYDVGAVRRRLADVDVAPLVDGWAAVHRGSVKADSHAHALAHVRWLLPGDRPVLASSVTTLWLSQRLAAYPGKQNTRRKVHSSWSVFFGYLARVRGLYAMNPMDAVPRARAVESPIRFSELETVERIVGAQPSPERRALFALLYGTGIEVSVALALTRADVWPATREVRAAGTKAHTRDRVARVAEWAWPIVAEHIRPLLPAARLFAPAWSRWTVSDWHRATVGDGEKDTHSRVVMAGFGLERRYPLHCARDHWAARAARVGTPIAVIQAQLGHESPTLTLKKYGRFLPSTADRAK